MSIITTLTSHNVTLTIVSVYSISLSSDTSFIFFASFRRSLRKFLSSSASMYPLPSVSYSRQICKIEEKKKKVKRVRKRYRAIRVHISRWHFPALFYAGCTWQILFLVWAQRPGWKAVHERVQGHVCAARNEGCLRELSLSNIYVLILLRKKKNFVLIVFWNKLNN